MRRFNPRNIPDAVQAAQGAGFDVPVYLLVTYEGLRLVRYKPMYGMKYLRVEPGGAVYLVNEFGDETPWDE